MPIQFPPSPTVNQEYTYEGKVWAWDGSSWVGVRQQTGILSSTIWAKQSLLIPKRGFGLNSGYNGTTDQRRTKAGTIPTLKHYMERDLGEFSRADSFFSSVSLLLHGNGSNGSTTITDSGPSPKTVTAIGNAQISTAQSKFGGTSIAFDGSGDYLSIVNNAAFNFQSSSFTVEAWVYVTTNNLAGSHCVASNYQDSANGWALQLSNGKMCFNASGDAPDIIGTTTFSTNTWYHVAVSGAIGSMKLFINGTQEGSTYTGAASLNSTAITTIGGLWAGALFNTLFGYIDELRITKGVARYTTNFTPPTEPFSDG